MLKYDALKEGDWEFKFNYKQIYISGCNGDTPNK